jgi:murein DD-endopeptidase MepM/ murein hydrolase activator NlpD
VLLLIGAYFINEQKKEDLSQKEVIVTTTLQKPLEVLISGNQLEQGDTLVVIAENLKTGQKITGEFDHKSFDFLPTETEGKLIGIIGIDVRKTPGDYLLKVLIDGEEKLNKKITITKGDFYVTKFVLTPELEKQGYTQSNIVQNIQTNDGVLIYQVLDKYMPEPYFNKSFIYPLDSIIKVGDFGTTRKEGDITLRHLGVDLDAPVGTLIYAINGGVVKFTKDLITYGKTIIIDHGFGIYSLYLHLSEFKVVVGDKVSRGEAIGLTGNTGYSLGPHLHFSIKANGASVDPLRFIDTFNSAFK